MGAVTSHECEACGGYLLHEREPFGRAVRVHCISCARDYTTPRREPTPAERDGTQVFARDGRVLTRRRTEALSGASRRPSKLRSGEAVSR